jgi:uncharacterized membrane protein YbhN (UPF0104 family)
MAGLARRTLPSLAAVALIAVLVVRLGAGPFLRALHTLDLRTAAAALAIGALTTVASAWRWVRAARGLGLSLERRRAVGDYYAALFLNGVLPGGVLGDVQRALRHGHDARNQRRAVTAVLVERTAGQVVLVLAVVTCVVLQPAVLPGSVHLIPGGPVVVALTLAVLTGTLVLVARSRRVVGPADTAAVLGASVVVLAGHLATFVVAARAAGSAAPVLSLVPLMLVALLAMSLPLNVAGWGPREGVTAWAFASAGMQAGQGLTVAVLYGLLALIASLPGAVVLVARGVTSRSRGDESARSSSALSRVCRRSSASIRERSRRRIASTRSRCIRCALLGSSRAAWSCARAIVVSASVTGQRRSSIVFSEASQMPWCSATCASCRASGSASRPTAS